MKALYSLFWSICRMSRGPEELPRSFVLLLVVLLLDASMGVGLQLSDKPDALDVALGMTALAVLMDALVLGGLSLFKNAQDRYVQSLSAIYGTDFLVSLFSLPLAVAGIYLAKAPWLPVIVFAQMLLVGWSLGIRAFIYHRSLRVGVLLANMLSLTLFLLTVFIAVKLFPELVPAAAAN
ncbi:MAG: hypothetical protein REI12_12505 [Pedobacter sp.]|nr:hypothetical protein [Pedobacter sp.]